MEALLRFLYRGAYDIPQPESEKLKVSPICFHAAMSTIADKYQLLKLKEYAFQRLRSVINKRECSLEELLNKGPLIFASLPAQDLGARAHIAFNVSRDYALSLSWTIDNNEKQLECAAEALHETLSAHPVFAKDVLRGLCVAIAVANDFFKRHNIVVGTSIKCAVCAGEKLRNPHDDGAPDSYWSCSDCARESFTKDWDAKIARREASDEARQAAGNVDSAIEKSENESGAKEKDLPFFYVR